MFLIYSPFVIAQNLCPPYLLYWCTMCEKHPDNIGILWEKFTNLLTCLWDVQIFPAAGFPPEKLESIMVLGGSAQFARDAQFARGAQFAARTV